MHLQMTSPPAHAEADRGVAASGGQERGGEGPGLRVEGGGSSQVSLQASFRPFETEGWRVGPRRPHNEAAFTLLHLLGVMLILAMLLLILLPPEVRQLDLAARKREAQALGVLSTGLRNFILDQRRIPARGTVFSDIADKVGMALPMVLTNGRGNGRVYLVDPSLRLGTNTAASLPYVQGTYGVTNVAGLRLLLVSSLGSTLPSIITTNNPGTNAARVFELLWSSADNVTPLGWTWGGDFRDIVVERLSLAPLFAQVIFRNQSADTGRFSVDLDLSLANPTNHVPLPASYFSSLYFVRTLLGLHNSTGAVQAVQVLQEVSLTTNRAPFFLCPTFVFEDGSWRGRYWKGTEAQRHKGEDLQAAYDLFMSGPANVYGLNSNLVNQQSVTMSMYLFMSNYVRWSDREFRWADKAAVQTAQAAMTSQVGAYCNPKATVP
jgi:type II secretory pathway pseudopilin PulG